jgi:hypothetical protein
MSTAKWCDVGQHAFSGDDLDGTTLSVTRQVGNQFGGAQPHTQQQDICGDCAGKMGLLGTAKAKMLNDRPRADWDETADGVGTQYQH